MPKKSNDEGTIWPQTRWKRIVPRTAASRSCKYHLLQRAFPSGLTFDGLFEIRSLNKLFPLPTRQFEAIRMSHEHESTHESALEDFWLCRCACVHVGYGWRSKYEFPLSRSHLTSWYRLVKHTTMYNYPISTTDQGEALPASKFRNLHPLSPPLLTFNLKHATTTHAEVRTTIAALRARSRSADAMLSPSGVGSLVLNGQRLLTSPTELSPRFGVSVASSQTIIDAILETKREFPLLCSKTLFPWFIWRFMKFSLCFEQGSFTDNLVLSSLRSAPRRRYALPFFLLNYYLADAGSSLLSFFFIFPHSSFTPPNSHSHSLAFTQHARLDSPPSRPRRCCLDG